MANEEFEAKFSAALAEFEKSTEPEYPETAVEEDVTVEEVPVVEDDAPAAEAPVALDADKIRSEYAGWVDPKATSIEDFFKHSGEDEELYFKRQLYKRAAPDSTVKEKLKADIEKYEASLEVKKLRDEIAAEKAAAQADNFRRTYIENARKHVSGLDEKLAPTIAKLVKGQESDWVISELLGEVQRDAQERFAKGDKGEPLTPQEAVKRLEAKYSRLAKVFAKDSKAPAPTPKKTVNVKLPESNTTPKTPRQLADEKASAIINEYLRDSRKGN